MGCVQEGQADVAVGAAHGWAHEGAAGTVDPAVFLYPSPPALPPPHTTLRYQVSYIS